MHMEPLSWSLTYYQKLFLTSCMARTKHLWSVWHYGAQTYLPDYAVVELKWSSRRLCAQKLRVETTGPRKGRIIHGKRKPYGKVHFRSWCQLWFGKSNCYAHGYTDKKKSFKPGKVDIRALPNHLEHSQPTISSK